MVVTDNAQKVLDKIKEQTLIYDVETSSQDRNRRQNIDIKDFDLYMQHVKVKWIGFYIYKTDEYLEYPVNEQTLPIIQDIFGSYFYHVGLNNEEFDSIACRNTGITAECLEIDIQKIVGECAYREGFKQRGKYMGINAKKFSMRKLAEQFKIDMTKGDIDYSIFYKETWSETEIKEIVSYLKQDVRITKELYDILWNYWQPFTDDLCDKNIRNISWIKASMASLVYKTLCDLFNREEVYCDIVDERESGGGHAVNPHKKEQRNVVYADVVSLYPHMFFNFGLSDEFVNQSNVSDYEPIKLFNVTTQGKYNKNVLCDVDKWLRDLVFTRINLKKIDKHDPRVYRAKILANTYYGMKRSKRFASFYTPNAGSDCCLLGREVHDFVARYMAKFGYVLHGGFTDSWFFRRTDGVVDLDEFKRLIGQAVTYIKAQMPFPTDTFAIEIETVMDVLLYNYDYKKRMFNKNNYYYVTKKGDEYKPKFVGLALMKDSGTPLSMYIYKTYLEPQIFDALRTDKQSVLFDKNYLIDLIQSEAHKDMTKLYVIKTCKSFKTYLDPNQLEAQISKRFFNGKSGKIRLIANNIIGSVGKGVLYCTENEFHRLRPEYLRLDKVYKQLNIFCKSELNSKKESVKLNRWFS